VRSHPRRSRKYRHRFARPDIPISNADRVYAADQTSNTVSVIDPFNNQLLGVIRLGNPVPGALSPLYRGQLLVHGMGYSPDYKTVAVVSVASNSAWGPASTPPSSSATTAPAGTRDAVIDHTYHGRAVAAGPDQRPPAVGGLPQRGRRGLLRLPGRPFHRRRGRGLADARVPACRSRASWSRRASAATRAVPPPERRPGPDPGGREAGDRAPREHSPLINEGAVDLEVDLFTR